MLFSGRNIVKLGYYVFTGICVNSYEIQLILKKSTLLFVILLAGYFSYGQQATGYTDKDYARNPVWIKMIKDTAANYFEAEKAFKIYFQHHENPGGEHDVIGEHAKQEKNISKREMRKMQAEDHMRMEVKRYKHWHDKMAPYVQADGSILTPSQRLKIWREAKK